MKEKNALRNKVQEGNIASANATLILKYSCCMESYTDGLSECDPLQYLGIGEMGTIKCSFDAQFYSVFWYNSSDTVNDEPILNFKETVKSGRGYLSGEYDVADDGSLIINETTLQHERTFTALLFRTRSEPPKTNTVSVIITVTPSTTFPVIDKCGKHNRLCFSPEEQGSQITCSVENSKPAVALNWVTRTDQGDSNISTQVTQVVEEKYAYSSFSTIAIGHSNTFVLSLLVCKATYSPQLLMFNESIVLIQYGDWSSLSPEILKKWARLGSTVELSCSQKNIDYLVWRRQSSDLLETTAIAVFIGVKDVQVLTPKYTVKGNGTLVIHDVEIEQEGLFVCICHDGEDSGVIMYDLSVYIIPRPTSPVVNGCSLDQYCVLEVGSFGTLVCSLSGVRPELDIQWKTYFESDIKMISFYDEGRKVTQSGDKFDIILTSKYRLNEMLKNRLTLKCEVAEDKSHFLYRSTTFELVFKEEHDTEANSYTNSDDTVAEMNKRPIAVIVVISSLIAFIFIVGIAVVLICRRDKKNKSKMHKEDVDQEQMTSMLPNKADDNSISAKTEALISQLRVGYQRICNTITPIPFARDGLYGVDVVYVEGGMKIKHRNSDGTSHGNWTYLNSYNDLFTDSLVKSNFLVIEGDPGIGKSTLAAKLASDWCTSYRSSPLKNFELLIFIRLKYLTNMQSFYETIKQFLLPKDTLLRNEDIEEILRKSKSALILLDGYDEAPSNILDTKSDIYHILTRNMLQQFTVILTTRTNCFPRNMSPGGDIFRLTGFNEAARRAYILKVVGDKDFKATEIIMECLHESPILGEFCQIPLFFVLFTHLAKREDLTKSFSTVTSFFRFIISCLQERQKLKNNNTEYDQYNWTDPSQLDKAAFELLTETDKLFWIKEELCAKVGKEFYEHYVCIGMLLGEETLLHSDGASSLNSEIPCAITKVTFYHKLFLEWHAAHYLSRYADQATTTELRRTLKNLDPSNLQYVYRFACGINPESGDRIIKYLKSIEDGETFATLCILEQTGNTESIESTLQDFCSETVLISSESSRLLQQSIVQLIDIASRKKVAIDCFHLENCISSVNVGKEHIQLTSGLHVDKFQYIKELKITEMGREFSLDTTSSILEFCLLCDGLQQLTFDCCLLPFSIEDRALIGKLQQEDITVVWIPTATWYSFCTSGNWKQRYGEKMLTETDYLKERDNLADFHHGQSKMKVNKYQIIKEEEILSHN
ncbi:hypothetical protein BSL78_11535 [Apostichopus japonicus]|uniref:NACHT domain-containing protein n=1 Tax=Stichopus japonicus TaxID=307972 RepID=A0A2G8KU83_STIJA|nr:hypothetical protein BSL78_11535 [Apostichopus japonicus]